MNREGVKTRRLGQGEMDVHATSIVVVRTMDAAKLQPPQTSKLADLPRWVRAELVMQRLSGLEVIRVG
jgi:hypothetical protein